VSTNPRLFGNYELQEHLVSGGMTEAWRAFDLHYQRTIVIKLLHADLQYNPDFMAHFWSLPLEREAQTLLSLHHPNIARIHGYYVSLPAESGNPMPYIVMDYKEGQSLAQYIHNTSYKGAFPPAVDLVHLFASLAAAIDYAHQQGIIHGYIKPSTILLGKYKSSQNLIGVPILTDFGITRLLGIPTYVLCHWEPDTSLYISPEQVEGHPATRHSDMYALGIILYEMCSGMRPFNGENTQQIMMRQVSTVPPALSEINPAVSPAVSAVIMRNLAKDPEERFSSATDMVIALTDALSIPTPEILKQYFSATDTMKMPVSPSEPAHVGKSRVPRIRRSHIALIIVLLLILAALIVGAFFVLGHGKVAGTIQTGERISFVRSWDMPANKPLTSENGTLARITRFAQEKPNLQEQQKQIDLLQSYSS
jgi:eukaryotic-like serine/threonine-protein kinase